MIAGFWRKMLPFLANEVLPVLIAAIYMLASAFIIHSLARPSRSEYPKSDYQLAADQTRRPDPRFISKSLLGIKFDHSVTVLTFTQAGEVPKFKQATAYKDVWVTEVPFIKAFCQAYVRLNGADRQQLELRLKERLGLPPDWNYDTFVELAVDPNAKDKDIDKEKKKSKNRGADAKLFRPCGDPSLDSNTCQPPALPAASDVWSDQTVSNHFQEWMLRNYYSNYASKEPFPWTALGYTFDWARKKDSEDFERFGESEFVIRKGAPIHFVAAASPNDYCASP